MRRFLNVLFLSLFTLVFIATPTLVVAARGPVDVTPPAVDWSQVLTSILTAVLPVLAVALTAQALASARYWWMKLEADRPDVVSLFQEAAQYAVPAIEQLRKSGVIPDGPSAKKIATSAATSFLLAKGVSQAQITTYSHILDNAIEAAVHYVNQSQVTQIDVGPLTTIQQTDQALIPHAPVITQ